MQVTRRFWTVASVGAALAVWGVVIDKPSLVAGAGIIGAWTLVVQYRFIRHIAHARPSLDVQLRPERERVTATDTTQVVFSAEIDEPTDLSMHVTVTSPVGAEGTIDSLILDELRQAVRRADVTWPVAGEFEFETPQVTFHDKLGLFTQTVAHGEGPRVVVEPRVPRDIHVGQGGDAIATRFGDHETDQTGSGLKPAEIRQYVPGDSIRQIDWKATARLAEPHVREFEVETDWETRLFVDHRATMADGPDEERKLDYARQLLLALLNYARTHGDPVACYTVGDAGLTAQYNPSTTADHLNAIRTELLNLSPTPAAPTGSDVVSPATVRTRMDRLSGDESAFGETLRPFFDNQTHYVKRIATKPLFEAMGLTQVDQQETGWTVILTDDRNQTELREAVKIARQTGGHVVVYLTPTILYERGALSDLDTAYERYRTFESFRRDLDSLDRVSAFEVGPRDQLTAILSAGTRAQQV